MSSLPKEMLSNLKRPVLFFEQRSLATIAFMHVCVPLLFTGILSGVGHIFVWCNCVIATQVTLQPLFI